MVRGISFSLTVGSLVCLQLGFEHVDLFLIHSPMVSRAILHVTSA